MMLVMGVGQFDILIVYWWGICTEELERTLRLGHFYWVLSFNQSHLLAGVGLGVGWGFPYCLE
jgi:hypothetical protein